MLAGPPLLAQGQGPAVPAQLRVVVLDQTGAGIPAATVTVTLAGGSPATAAADERGVATFTTLPIGSGQLRVDAPGFVSFDAPLTLRRGANNQTATLKIEGSQEQVGVDAAAGPGTGRAWTTAAA